MFTFGLCRGHRLFVQNVYSAESRSEVATKRNAPIPNLSILPSTAVPPTVAVPFFFRRHLIPRRDPDARATSLWSWSCICCFSDRLFDDGLPFASLRKTSKGSATGLFHRSVFSGSPRVAHIDNCPPQEVSRQSHNVSAVISHTSKNEYFVCSFTASKRLSENPPASHSCFFHLELGPWMPRVLYGIGSHCFISCAVKKISPERSKE